jgi:hypothetical protein
MVKTGEETSAEAPSEHAARKKLQWGGAHLFDSKSALGPGTCAA